MRGRTLLLIGTVLYVLAWCLPVADTDNVDISSWDAFLGALWPFDGSDPWYTGIHYVASAVSNVCLVGALILVLLARRSPPRVLVVTLMACAILNTHWFMFTFGGDRGDLRIGYYLWAVSFFLVAAGLAREARRPGVP